MVGKLLLFAAALFPVFGSAAEAADCVYSYAHKNKLSVATSTEEEKTIFSIARWDGRSRPTFTDCKKYIARSGSSHPLASDIRKLDCSGLILATDDGITYSIIHDDTYYPLSIANTWSTRNDFEKSMGEDVYSSCQTKDPMTITWATHGYSFHQSGNLSSEFLVIRETNRGVAVLKSTPVF